MNMNKKDLAFVILVIILFLASLVFSQFYSNAIKEIFLLKGAVGMAFYVLIAIAAVVIAPISALPLLPVAATLWGGFTAALLSIIGWAIGAVAAFWLSRRYGRPLLVKIVNLEKIEKIEKAIPSKNLFFGVVFLRMAFPVDILSYALGLFSNISFPSYTAATLIGIVPFAFIFSYTAEFPLWYKLAAVVLGITAALIGYRRVR